MWGSVNLTLPAKLSASPSPATAFSMNRYFGRHLCPRLLAIACFMMPLAYMPQSASANDRMAGGQSGASAAIVQTDTMTADRPDFDSTGVIDVDFQALENVGVAQIGDSRYLGIDLWKGSRRSEMITMLPLLPINVGNRRLQFLSEGLLVTPIDTNLIRRNESPVNGQDFTTIRLSQLMSRGAFQDSFSLFTAGYQEAYNESLARNGVLAIFLNQKPTLACLEVKAMADRFEKIDFWTNIHAFCRYMTGATKNKETIDTLSPIQKQVIENKRYRYSVSKASDLEAISIIDLAVLIAKDRLDTSRLRVDHDNPPPQHLVRLLAEHSNTPLEIRFQLFLVAATMGLKNTDDLAALYESDMLEIANSGARTDWQRLPTLYRDLKDKETITKSDVAKILALKNSYPLSAFMPFEDFFTESHLDSLNHSDLRFVMALFATTGTQVSYDILKTWQQNADSQERENILQYLFITDLSSELSPELQQDDQKNHAPPLYEIDIAEYAFLSGMNEAEAAILENIYEKLDKRVKFHNYDAERTYDKDARLTLANDYVMPIGNLLRSLEESKNKKRLGEVILISSILHQATIDNYVDETTSLKIFAEITDSLVTVGLTKTALSYIANAV